MSQLKRITTTAVVALALAAAPALAAGPSSPQARPDGGVPLAAQPDPHSASARPDGGIVLPSSDPVVTATSGGDGDGVGWGYFAGGGVLMLTLSGRLAIAARQRRARPVKATAAH